MRVDRRDPAQVVSVMSTKYTREKEDLVGKESDLLPRDPAP